MDNYIVIGKIINTFGIKGELKVISDFEYKEKVLKPGINLYIGKEKYRETIFNRRVHKNYDLILFENYTNINEVLKYKGEYIYILRDDLNLGENEYLLSDLVGMNVYDNNDLIGVVIDYEKGVNNVLLKIKGEKSFYLPLIPEYIKEVVVNEKKIITKNGKELIL